MTLGPAPRRGLGVDGSRPARARLGWDLRKRCAAGGGVPGGRRAV